MVATSRSAKSAIFYSVIRIAVGVGIMFPSSRPSNSAGDASTASWPR